MAWCLMYPPIRTAAQKIARVAAEVVIGQRESGIGQGAHETDTWKKRDTVIWTRVGEETVRDIEGNVLIAEDEAMGLVGEFRHLALTHSGQLLHCNYVVFLVFSIYTGWGCIHAVILPLHGVLITSLRLSARVTAPTITKRTNRLSV